MTPFEFVFALVSVITSLALTHIIGGVVALIRARRRISLVHGLWVAVAFLVVIGNWGGLWGQHWRSDWPASLIVAQIVSMTALYAWAALVLPADVDSVGPDFHEREGRTYMTAHLVFALIVIPLALLRYDTIGEAIGARLPATVAVVLGALALLVRNSLVQLGVAALLCIMAAGYAWSNLHIAV